MAGLSTVATPPLRKGRVKNGSIFLATAVEMNLASFPCHVVPSGFQPNGKEGACRMRSLPSGSRGCISFTRWQTATKSRLS